MKDKELKELLELYFEGNTTLEQEERLRRAFLSGKVRGEARKYMPLFVYLSLERSTAGVDNPAKGLRPVRRRRIMASLTGVAAVAAALGMFLLGGRYSQGSPGVILTIGGQQVTDETMAVEIVDRELERLGDLQVALNLGQDVLEDAAEIRKSTVSVLKDRIMLDLNIR